VHHLLERNHLTKNSDLIGGMRRPTLECLLLRALWISRPTSISQKLGYMGYGGKAFKGHTTQLLDFQIEFTKVNNYELTLI